jgi:phosphoribosylformimino-5-aminoimidazole carboxamide ribotide isomerase
MRIIIAIDILGGKCVRLAKGDYNTSKIYNEDPLEIARQIEDNGLKFIHLVDLDGARSKHVINQKILKKITGSTSLIVDFGGGIKSAEDLKIAFEYGASQVTCGSTAVYDPENFMKWLSVYGAEKIILGADSKDHKITTNGWMQNTNQNIIKFVGDYFEKGVRYAICTDIEKDGMLKGPSVDLYREILSVAGINLIASGGITTITDIEELEKAGCEGSIIGKAVYEGKLTLKELSRLC